MKHIILGTAGHIDHGKTSLVRALTGIDTDRLPEEKSRGITIELGFAFLSATTDLQISIVDVPGHERFLHHMIAGVGGIDYVMMVIAADEGIMPQTREHLDICGILGVQRGLIALTKTDLVEDEWIEMVCDDIRKYMNSTFLRDAPIIPVSAQSGLGINTLRQQLIMHATQIKPRSNSGVFRLPVDRVFTIKGFGTVITGTVTSGQVNTQTSTSLVPSGPTLKIRGLQVHGKSVDIIQAGQRAAVNLQNADREAITRGMVLGLPDQLPQSRIINAHVTLLSSVSRPLKNRQRIRLYLSTAEVIGKAIILDREELLRNESGFIQFRMESLVSCLPGDRFLLRDYSPMETLGGGVILDPEARISKRYVASTIAALQSLVTGNLKERFLATLTFCGIEGLHASRLQRKFPQDFDQISALASQLAVKHEIVEIEGSNRRFIGAENWNHLKAVIIETIKAFHVTNPLQLGITREELRTSISPNPPTDILQRVILDLLHKGTLLEEAMTIRLPSHVIQMTDQQQELNRQIECIIREAGFQGAEIEALVSAVKSERTQVQKILNVLLNNKILIRLPGGLIFHKESIEALRTLIITIISAEKSLSVGRFRDSAGISRKQAVPLLEYFDSIGLTRRMQDMRVLRT